MRKTLREYLLEYAAQHRNPGTKVTHMIGIPMIVASLPLFPFVPVIAAGLFVVGWIFQFIGHWVFESNSPAFADDPFHLVVGPIWVLIEWARIFGVTLPFDPIAA